MGTPGALGGAPPSPDRGPQQPRSAWTAGRACSRTSSRLSGTGWWLWPTKPGPHGVWSTAEPGLVRSGPSGTARSPGGPCVDQLALDVLISATFRAGRHLVDEVLHVERVIRFSGWPSPCSPCGVGVYDEQSPSFSRRAARNSASGRRQRLPRPRPQRPRWGSSKTIGGLEDNVVESSGVSSSVAHLARRHGRGWLVRGCNLLGDVHDCSDVTSRCGR